MSLANEGWSSTKPVDEDSTTSADEESAIELLGEEVSRYRKQSDLSGLIRVQMAADTVARSSDGRKRKKATRVAERAGEAIRELRRAGVETSEELEARQVREALEARTRSSEERRKLLQRSASSLEFLLSDRSETAAASAVFQPLAPQRGSEPSPALAEAFGEWSSLMLDGFHRSRLIFADVATQGLLRDRQEVVRVLKSTAVELMTNGADVRGVAVDAVPLITYGLFRSLLPVAAEAFSSATVEGVNDLLLSAANPAGEISGDRRPLFLGLFRLSILLGEAQAYSDKLSLGSLSLG